MLLLTISIVNRMPLAKYWHHWHSNCQNRGRLPGAMPGSLLCHLDLPNMGLEWKLLLAQGPPIHWPHEASRSCHLRPEDLSSRVCLCRRWYRQYCDYLDGSQSLCPCVPGAVQGARRLHQVDLHWRGQHAWKHQRYVLPQGRWWWHSGKDQEWADHVWLKGMLIDSFQQYLSVMLLLGVFSIWKYILFYTILNILPHSAHRMICNQSRVIYADTSISWKIE